MQWEVGQMMTVREEAEQWIRNGGRSFDVMYAREQRGIDTRYWQSEHHRQESERYDRQWRERIEEVGQPGGLLDEIRAGKCPVCGATGCFDGWCFSSDCRPQVMPDWLWPSRRGYDPVTSDHQYHGEYGDL